MDLKSISKIIDYCGEYDHCDERIISGNWSLKIYELNSYHSLLSRYNLSYNIFTTQIELTSIYVKIGFEEYQYILYTKSVPSL